MPIGIECRLGHGSTPYCGEDCARCGCYKQQQDHFPHVFIDPDKYLQPELIVNLKNNKNLVPRISNSPNLYLWGDDRTLSMPK